MRTLQECLKISLNEAQSKFYMVNDHYNPGELYIIENPSLNTLEQIRNTDWNYEEIDLDPNENIVLISWNDEGFINYGGGKTIAEIKKNSVEAVKKSLDEYGYAPDEEVEEVNAGLMYLNPMVPRKVFEKNPWKYFEDVIKYSYVDGDSNRCRALIDIKKKKVLLCGENEITFLNDKEALKFIFGLED